MFRWLTGLRLFLRSAIRRKRAEQELEEEFQYHLEQEINERLKDGLSPEEARYAALRAMGAIGKSIDECRDTRGTRWLEELFHDIRSSFRSIKRSKGLALGVLISMGLGLGATATIFSFVDSFVLRPLPVPDTSHVVRITNSTPAGSNGRFSYPEIQDYAERSQSFEGIVTFQTITAGLAPKPADQPRVTLATLVSGNFFSVLRVKPALGRGFLPEEDSVPGRDAVAVISHMTWQRDFGGAADIVGRTTTIDGHAFTIVGVAPPEFLEVELFAEPEIFIPRMMAQEPYMGLGATDLTNRSARYTGIFARLKPGVTSERANAEMARIASQLELEHPETNKETKAVVMTQAEYQNQGRKNGGPGVALFGIAFLVLGIACVNVSNLLLSAAPARTREMAVRVAMGAPRRRLVKQLLLESAILSSGGILAGLAIASWCAAFLSSIRVGSSLLQVHAQVRIDEGVVFFTLAVGLVSAFLSGAIPAWRCSRYDLNSLLKSSDPRNRPQKTWGRQLLAGAQVAVSALLLVVSGLFIKDLQMAARQNPGFRVDHLLTMSLDPSIAGYDTENIRAFYRELVTRVRALPGVKSATFGWDKPFGVLNGSTNLTIEGYELPPNQKFIGVQSALVGNGYFETLDVPIIRGRAFDGRDRINAPRTVIVNETMAQKFWPNRDPIGARVEIKGNDGGSAEVIGIARNYMADRPTPFLYRSYDQAGDGLGVLFVETHGPPEGLTSAVRAEVRRMNPNVPIFDVRTMQEYFYETALFEPRLKAEIITSLGTVGLILGVLGLYGVIAYSVAQRTYEIGIRMAVGASNSQVLKMVLLQGLRSSCIAAAIGTGLALALKGTMSGKFSYVNPGDPTIYAGVFLLILFVTGAACYIPARRASLVDPNITLRN